MTTIDYGPDVADLRTRLAGAHTEIGRLQDECLRIAEERDARPAIMPRHAKQVLRFIFAGIGPSLTESDMEAMEATFRALEAHAKGGDNG